MSAMYKYLSPTNLLFCFCYNFLLCFASKSAIF